MMSFVDTLRSLRTAPQAVWLEFIGTYSVASFDIYLFFEGKDDFSFYQPFVRRHWGQRGGIVGFNCDGKDEVIEIIPRVKQKLDYEWRGLFFLDKDLDDYCCVSRVPDRFVYETECYSIENFIASPSTLTIIWTDLLQLPLNDPRHSEMHNAFSKAYDTFCDTMKSVMAWVIHLRRSGRKVNLRDVKMNKLIRLDQECNCSLVAGWADHILAASSLHDMTYDAASHEAIVSELTGRDPKTYIRGKFDLWYFVAFLQRTLEVLREKASNAPAATCSIQIGQANALDALSARIIIPDSLQNFLVSALPG
jgi:hypothetical protein